MSEFGYLCAKYYHDCGYVSYCSLTKVFDNVCNFEPCFHYEKADEKQHVSNNYACLRDNGCSFCDL